MKRIYSVLALMLSLSFSVQADIQSMNGLFEVKRIDNNQTIKVNQYVVIQLAIKNLKTQKPMKQIKTVISGGMPIHDHGLPTQPQLVAGDTANSFNLEGLKFNMPGEWVIKVQILSPNGDDTFEIPLNVKF